MNDKPENEPALAPRELTPADVAAELARGNRVLLMVRHAERPKMDHDDASFGETLPLTPAGVAMAERFGRLFAAFAADAQFVASPLLRTRMTAEAIARGMGLWDAPVAPAPELGNSSFYFSSQREVFELFRDGGFFEKIFAYFAKGEQRGFAEIHAATDALEEWCLARFTGRLGIFATHDLYVAAYLHARGVETHFTVDNWIRFLDSAAVIVAPDGSRRYALVRAGLTDGLVGVAETHETALVCGARSGRYPLELLARDPALALTVHAFDAHQARKIREDLAAAGRCAEVICAADLPANRTWSRAFFYDDKNASAELKLDVLQNLFSRVAGGGKGRVEGVDAPTRKKVLARERDFTARFEASVPGGGKLSFLSRPGCFCHRRPDVGGLALAEVAARLAPDGARLVDFGCGCGFVGLLAADALRRRGAPARRLAFVDSHARAVDAARANARALGCVADFHLTDLGLDAQDAGGFDLFLGNPPYYGDWSIAELFLSEAARVLAPGGVCLAVAKSAKGLRAVQERHFATVEEIPRRGYVVLKSVKE